MDPSDLLPQVGLLDKIGIDTGLRGGNPELLEVHAGRTSGDNDAVEIVLLDHLHESGGRLGVAHELVLFYIDDVLELLGESLQLVEVKDSVSRLSAIAKEHSDPGGCSFHVITAV
jgi:hypothetical protein